VKGWVLPPPNIRNKARLLPLPLLVNIALGVLSWQLEKKMKKEAPSLERRK
jgi:hypothetical protein